MKQINWPLVILAFLSLFSVGIIDNARSSIYPDILKILNLTYEQGSLIFSISSLTGLLSTLSAKYWLPKYGIIIPQRFFSFILILSAVIFGAAISFANSYPLLLMGCTLIGIGMGGLSITMNLSIDRAVPEEYRRKFLSALHSLYGLSSGFAPVILLFLNSWGKGFQELYFVIAIFPLILLILCFNKKKLNPQTMLKENNHQASHVPLLSILFTGSILSLYVCSEVALSSRFIIISRSLGQVNNSASQSYLSIFFILLTFGRIIFAFIKTKKTNFSILLFSIVTSFALYFLALITKKSIFLGLIGLSMSVYFPCAMDLLAQTFKENLSRSLPIVMNVVTIKLISMHYVAGFMEQRFGPISTLYLSFALMFLAFFSLLLNKKFFKPTPS